MQQYRLRLLESSFAGKDVGVLIDRRFICCRGILLTAKAASCMLGCNSKGIAMGVGKCLFPSLALRQSVQILSHHFWASQETKGFDLMEPVQLEGYPDGLGPESWVWSPVRRGSGETSAAYSYLIETKPDLPFPIGARWKAEWQAARVTTWGNFRYQEKNLLRAANQTLKQGPTESVESISVEIGS